MKKFINIAQNELNQPIYRIYSCDRLLEVLKTSNNLLVRPDLWEDPFENVMQNIEIIEYKNNRPIRQSFSHFRYCLYGQCWTFEEESDMLWRLYSPNRDGVKVKTTAKRLFESLNQSKKVIELKEYYKKNPQYITEDFTFSAEIDCYIGKVKYLSERQLGNYFKSKDFIEQKNLYKSIETILFKRKEFSHEREIRLLCWHYSHFENQILEYQDRIFKYEFNPLEIFEEIVFDPRLSDYRFEAILKYIKSLGYKKKIIKSTLYKVPEKINIIKK